ncbi:universal stress protein [Pacificimonas sp. WHA3]|uniref:Universal stress protein n=1 Tax=Pacificimonas pallii TaxID=2827236 RepID=A0ABS6SDH5_9SPHN|nr:universal stress protein [Pacificimonas pallii]MBV7256305.1 universal stress protein [Pacificimonas pallii]
MSEEERPRAPNHSGPGYLLVVDDSEESARALRYAAGRAKSINGSMTLLHVIAPPEFLQWGGVQEMIAEEAQEEAESVLARAADEVIALSGIRPSLLIRKGKLTDEVTEALAADPGLSALVLGAAAKGAPGTLVQYFSGERAGALPAVIIIVPGALDIAAIDRLTGNVAADDVPDYNRGQDDAQG